MPYQTRIVILIVLLLLDLTVLPAAAVAGGTWFSIPEPLPAETYGNILIDRTSGANGMKPVIFSHWVHRRKHTCRVCHFELEFNMKANTTEISEDDNRAGRFCGACHDGKMHDGEVLFGHEDRADCGKCHTGDLRSGADKFNKLRSLPRSGSGNGVDWNRAIEKELITPQHELYTKAADMNFDKRITLEADWYNIPPAVFPHDRHLPWLDCNNCHPDIFNIKKKTTKHFLMTRILSGEFCGVCHRTVAFPLSECRKCHPKIKEM